MPKTSEMIPSKYLKRDDVGRGVLVTIKGVKHENVGKEEDPELKYVALFNEVDKPLVLNLTNIKLLEAICQSDDTDGWIGKQVVLYDDPTVMFKGEVKGGIRVRAPKDQKNDLPF